jgi:SOS-response transcriptional repressor LexA
LSAPGAFSWNSELPSGRNPFWIRDDALAEIGLHAGDAVSVDTSAEPRNGDLVVAEVELDGDSHRVARRYFLHSGSVRLESVGESAASFDLPRDSVMVMGVIVSRLRFSAEGGEPIEEPLAP